MEQDSTALLRGSPAFAIDAAPDPARAEDARLLEQLRNHLESSASVRVGSAPQAFDLFAGMSERFGALTLHTALSTPAMVMAAPRSDGLLFVAPVTGSDRNGATPWQSPLAALRAGSTLIEARDGRISLALPPDLAIRCTVGTVVELAREGLVDLASGGFSISVADRLPELAVESRAAGMCAAVAKGMLEENVVRQDRAKVARACRRAATDWAGTTATTVDVACALFAEVGLVGHQNAVDTSTDPSEPFRLPSNIVIHGVLASGPNDRDGEKFAHMLTASFMGGTLIDRILQHEEKNRSTGAFGFARMRIKEYVDRFRDRLPTKMSGKEFIDRFGNAAHGDFAIDPTDTYKVRSRTEHHIYEHSRADQFIQGLARAIRTGDRAHLVAAGSHMYSSHWSFGQRCGLGCPMADKLVGYFRDHCATRDIFGAKLTGHGCGGVIAVLALATNRAQDAMQEGLENCHKSTGIRPRLTMAMSGHSAIAS